MHHRNYFVSRLQLASFYTETLRNSSLLEFRLKRTWVSVASLYVAIVLLAYLHG